MPMKLHVHLTIILSKLVALSLKVTDIPTKLTSKRFRKQLSAELLASSIFPTEFVCGAYGTSYLIS